jgi:UPF0716 family protein affecting phage T7 exclusion
MAYKLLGMVVWRGGKWFLRRRYGTMMAPKPMLAGGALLVIAGILLAVRGRGGGD